MNFLCRQFAERKLCRFPTWVLRTANGWLEIIARRQIKTVV